MLVDSDGAPRDRIVGFETEYGLGYRGSEVLSNTAAAEEVARWQWRVSDRKEYQSTGERIYLDAGWHPELSTAEETSFLGAAHRVLAGHVKMARRYKAGAEAARENNPEFMSKGNIELVANTTDPRANSWGSHENYLAPRALKEPDYIAALVVHHLSRIVWSGTGTITETADGFRFDLSEKANHLWELSGMQTTRSRPLVNLRDKPYADKRLFRRIHNVAGESLMNPHANALRLATGSIVLRGCELGVSFDDLMPDNPLRAIRQISADPTLQRKVELKDGRHMSGLDLQQAIAERSIKAAVAAQYLTPQEMEWAENWQGLLGDLKGDPDTAKQRVDWIFKQRLVERELAAKKDSDEPPLMVAWSKAIDFHRLLPEEGAGMRLLRKGFFVDSPSQQVLENDLPLPATRARLRGELIGYFDATDRYLGVKDWFYVNSEYASMHLKDPYATSDPRFDSFISKVA